MIDLPGIYSLSPYTLEEVVARNYLINERPDAILNIVDGSNIERNLYLTTQLTELGIPVVVAVNMMDVVKKNGDHIDFERLSKELGCEVVAISALKGTGVHEAAQRAVTVAKDKQRFVCGHQFNTQVEGYLNQIADRLGDSIAPEQKRFYAIKLFERDEKISVLLNNLPDISDVIGEAEREMDDDTESIITNERYNYISSIINKCYHKRNKSTLTTSDKIDKVVTNRWLALPIFAVVMFIVYFVSVTTVGTWATDWANDGVFGDGWHLFGIGSSAYEESVGEWETEQAKIEAFLAGAAERGIDTTGITEALEAEEPDETAMEAFAEEAATVNAIAEIENEDGEIEEEIPVNISAFQRALATQEPDPADFGVWVPGIPVLFDKALEAMGTTDWLNSLILDGIVAGVGAVLGFVPQLLVLFLFLAFLEACGYMARIAFVMDRIFRKFGLSGKSFIPILIGTGCGIPGIMASRTIENERDRRMTIMTTTFIPCGAKQPFIAMMAGAIFGGSAWIATGAYFLGMAAIVISGIILKKTKMFAGDPAPFVMELPPYHMPTVGNVLRSMWERGWSFIKKAGTIITLSTIFVWFTSFFGWVDGSFGMLTEDQMSCSILAYIGKGICWLFAPLGWGNWQATVAAVTGLVAKENIVATMGILYGGGDGVYANLAAAFTGVAGMSFLIFNLLCAPCFAAMGAIKREMNNAKWFWFAIGYECGFAYAVSLVVYQLGELFSGNANILGTIVAFALVAFMIYMLVRPYKESNTLRTKVRV